MRWLRLPLWVLLAVAGIVIAYLSASVIGAAIPLSPREQAAAGPTERIYMLTTPLHADYAVPVTDAVRERFAFLGDIAGIPIDNPKLEFLIFGWGSRAFYTTARTYADVRPGPTLRAIVGDNSVLHIVPAGDISRNDNVYRLDLPPGGISRLLDHIEESFAPDAQNARYLPDAGYGFGDVFFEAKGGFNIFRPCNIWAATGLRRAGLTTGWWTPTTHSLFLGLRLHSGSAVAEPG